MELKNTSERFPEVGSFERKEIYFGAGNRLGIEAATRDILVLLKQRYDCVPRLFFRRCSRLKGS